MAIVGALHVFTKIHSITALGTCTHEKGDVGVGVGGIDKLWSDMFLQEPVFPLGL